MSSRLSSSGKHAALNTGRNLFIKYRHTLHKNTLDPKDYYWYGWSDKERDALELLRPKKAINHTNSMTVYMPSIASKREFIPRQPKIRLHFGRAYDAWPYPEVSFDDEQIVDAHKRAELLQWAVRNYQLLYFQNKFDTYMKAVLGGGALIRRDSDELPPLNIINGCNTPGQLYRAWPQFASLVEPKYTQRMAAQKLRSAMPTGWSEKILEEFQALPAMKEINEILLTIAMMSGDLDFEQFYPDTH